MVAVFGRRLFVFRWRKLAELVRLRSANLKFARRRFGISSVDLALYLEALTRAFPLSWSHYVRLLTVEKPEARRFYETESLRGGCPNNNLSHDRTRHHP